MLAAVFVCADDDMLPRLTAKKVYPVIGMSTEYYRVIDDEDEPLLFPRPWFEPSDLSPPPNWDILTDLQENYYYADLPGLGGKGFYEKYFDGDAAVVARYREIIKNQLR